MRKKSLKNFLYLIIFSAFAFILGVYFITTSISKAFMISQIEAEQKSITYSVSTMVENYLNEPVKILNSTHSLLHESKLIQPNLINRYLENLIQNYPFFESLEILDRNFKIQYLAPFNPDLISIDRSFSDFSKNLSNTDQLLHWSDSFISLQTGFPTITLAVKCPKAVTLGHMNLSYLGRQLQNIQLSQKSFIALIDETGNYITHPNNDLVKQRASFAHFQKIRQIPPQKVFSFYTTEKDKTYLYNTIKIAHSNWYVILTSDTKEILAAADKTYLLLILVSILSVIIPVLVLRKTLNSILKSLFQLVLKSKIISSGDYNIQMESSPYQELNTLAENFTLMSQNIQSREIDLKNSQQQIQKLNEDLEAKVIERTEQYERTNEELQASNEELAATNQDLEITLNELKEAQNQLILSEKMSLLGQLVAGIAHEINSPLGAIRSSNQTNMSKIFDTLATLPQFLHSLTNAESTLFYHLLEQVLKKDFNLNTQEQRNLKKQLLHHLQTRKMTDSNLLAEYLDDCNIYDADKILQTVSPDHLITFTKTLSELSVLTQNSKIIDKAAEKATKVILALKTYAHNEEQFDPQMVDIQESIETVLTIYHNKTKQGVEIQREYQPIPQVSGFADKLHQVWTNIINNAIQAMNYKGILKISVSDMPLYVKVTFTDNGPGIPLEIQPKIFIPFFTTKKAGEGSGLGLDISKKIIEEQGGKIEFHSRPGETTFTIYLKKQEE